jgi:hypothetical protein
MHAVPRKTAKAVPGTVLLGTADKGTWTAAARRGKPRHVIEAIRAANLGRKHNDQTRC